MTLNLPRPSIFPTLSPEEGMCSSIKFGNGYLLDRCPDRNFNGLADGTLDFLWDLENSFDFDFAEEKDEKGSSDGSVSDDILEILPADPFGMDVAATFNALTGWFEEFERDWEFDTSRGFGIDEFEVKTGDHQIFTGLNLFPNFSPEVYEKENLLDMENSGSYDAGAPMCLNQESNRALVGQLKEFQDCATLGNDGGAPHDALYFALGYLEVLDLISAERVCKSFRNAIRSDPLLWRNIHIGQPLSDRLDDDTLLQLTDRAQGTLQSLSLVGCLGISDSGLKRVCESNPRLTKLSVPGCVKLSVQGILLNLKALKSAGAPGIRYLRIGGIYGITSSQFEELKFLLGVDNKMQLKSRKPRFYHRGQLDVSCDDDRAIDIESCPKCQEVRLVYDCPAESCQQEHPAQTCRACTLCIARCIHCGRCINNCDYEETFCLDLLCLNCWTGILNQEKLDVSGTQLSKQTIFHREATYHFCFMATKD